MKERSLDQHRAEAALTCIRQVEQVPGRTVQAEYLSYSKALPATILQNGLGQAMAALLAASKNNERDPHRLLYRHLEGWLCREHEEAPYAKKKDLMEAIINHEQANYLCAQAEAQAFLSWLKKFASAYLKGS